MNRKERRAKGLGRLRESTSGPGAHCHHLVASTAKEMAHALYDECMHNNEWYGNWKAANPEANAKTLEERFVANQWPGLVPAARAILAGMLSLPENETLKETITEALLLDNTLVRGRRTITPSGLAR